MWELILPVHNLELSLKEHNVLVAGPPACVLVVLRVKTPGCRFALSLCHRYFH